MKLSRNADCHTYQRIRKSEDNKNKICVGHYLYIGNVQLQCFLLELGIKDIFGDEP